MPHQTYWAGRGFPWEFDAGPPKNLKWPRIFAETPNYRAIGKHVFGRERFRWHFGPMFFRGRLGRNQVKVLIVGQEGAQDESLSHRSFTGSTGTRMQYFLNYLGVDRSYLFLNTFVYPIFNQYTGNKLKWLAQNPASPIARHRYELFDYVLARNDVQLVVAVGQAAKESVHDWVISRGGTCPDGTSDLSTATGQFLDATTKIVGVRHPGGLAHAGSAAAIRASFQDAVDQIATWQAADPGWLSPDPGVLQDFSLPYSFLKSQIPFRDLPLGTCWRLGFGSTTSNRKNSQRSIQLFAKTGRYSANVPYPGNGNGSAEGYEQDPEDLPYEPPKKNYKAYDKGPSASFTRLLMGGKPGYAWPDFEALGCTAHPSLGYGPIYRGRPAASTFFILADQHAHDDLFTTRAFTGNAGQHFQSFLKAAGITESYFILRSLPVDTLDLTLAERKTIIDDQQVQKVYRKIMKGLFRYRDAKVILLVGPVSQYLWDMAGITTTLPVIRLDGWAQPTAGTNWQSGLDSLRNIPYGKDAPADFQMPTTRTIIPRMDLPYGTLRWQGTSGDRALRALDSQGNPDGRYYKYFQPKWSFDEASTPLTPGELADLSNAP